MDYNKVLLVGRVGKDPIVSTTRNGVTKAYFSLATHRAPSRQSTSAEKKETTEWHDISFFKDKADEVIKRVKKGDLLKIEGSIHYYPLKIGDKAIQKAEIWGNSFSVMVYFADQELASAEAFSDAPVDASEQPEDFDPTKPSMTTPISFAQLAEEDNK